MRYLSVMTGGRQRSIAKVRTFGEDVSRARGSSGRDTVTTPAVNPAPVPPPTAVVSPTPEVVPPVPERATPVQAGSAPVPSTEPAPTAPVLPVPELQQLSATVPVSATPYATVTDTALPEFSAEGDEYSEGTIITDKKRERFKLFPAIGQAVGGWASDAKETLTAKPDEPSVRKVETRLETLKAAAKVSNMAPRDDHGLVVKRLTEVERAPVVPTANIKAATAVPPPQWKHVAEAADSEREESTAAKDTGPIEPTPRRVTLTVGAATPAPTKPSEAPTVPPVRTAQVSEPPRPATRRPIPVRTVSPALPPNETPAPEPPAAPPAPLRQPAAAPQSQQRKLVLIGVVVVVGASLLGGGVGTLWYLSQTPATTSPEALPATTLITGASSVTIPLGDTRESLLSTLSETTRTTTSLTTFRFTVSDTEAPREAQLMSLSWRAPGNFLRSIRELTLGATESAAPFIIIKSTDFNTGFAGMLAWEAAMSSDLEPLFGSAVTESFDPTARTDNQLRSAFFRDEVVGNVSVRTLVDASNTDRIVYGFLTPSLILITTDSTTFLRLQQNIPTNP